MKKQKNFINGKWVAPASNHYLKKINPADKKKVLGLYPMSDKKDIDRAVKAARKALNEWAGTPAPERGEILYRMAALFDKKKTKLSKIIVNENGKPYSGALAEIQGAVDMANYYAGEGRRMHGQTTPTAIRRKTGMTVRVPVGVVGTITSWNNPLAAFCWKVLPALICGNCVVHKPAEDTPETSAFCIEIAMEAGLPPGVLNLIHGTGEVAGRAIVNHPGIDMISFTGSTEVGCEITSACGQGLKKVCLECGGKNSLVIMDDADLEKAVDAALWGAFGNAGQKCANTGRVLLQKKIAPRFRKMLLANTKKLKLGPASDKRSQIGPVINEAQLKKIHQYVLRAVKNGARVLTGGKVEISGECKKGFYYKPTILDKVTVDSEIAQEEVFGPVTVIMEFNKFDEAVEIVNNTHFGLTNSIYTQDISLAYDYLTKVDSGIVYVNGATFGAEFHLPFGGTKDSGIGFRESGLQALDAYSEWKTLYVNY